MPNFCAAALRHMSDSDSLSADSSTNRADNASQLAAYGAECLLKGILQKSGILTLSPSGKPNPPFDIHLNQGPTKDLVMLYSASQSGAGSLPSLGATAFFSGWTISSRYEGPQFAGSTMHQHQADANAFRSILASALLKGQI